MNVPDNQPRLCGQHLWRMRLGAVLVFGDFRIASATRERRAGMRPGLREWYRKGVLAA